MINLDAAEYYAGIYPDGLLPGMDKRNIRQLSRYETRRAAEKEGIHILRIYDYLVAVSQAIDKLNKMEINTAQKLVDDHDPSEQESNHE